MDGEQDLNLVRLTRTQKDMAQMYADNLGLACQLVSVTYVIIWSNIKKKERLASSLIKHPNYTTEDNIRQLIRQLVEEAKKTKVVLECSYQFGRRADGVVPLESTAGLPENSGNSSALPIGLASSISTAKNEKKKPGRKTTNRKTPRRSYQKSQSERRSGKNAVCITSHWTRTDSKCQYSVLWQILLCE